MGGHFAEAFETAVVDLLLAALGGEVDDLHGLGIVEKRHVGIVERKVPVFTDTEEHDVGGHLFEQCSVSAALLFRVLCLRVHVVDGLGRHFGKNAVFEEFPECLGGIGIDADVLIHVECIDAVPFDFMREQRS